MRTIALFLFLYFPAIAFADIIQVPGDYLTIQGGIDATVDGDTVLVDAGIYEENIVFDPTKNIVLKSVEGCFNTEIRGIQPNPRIINSVVRIECSDSMIDEIDGSTVINGFKITNGKGIDKNKETGDQAGTALGGGILIWNCSPTIMNCIITNNECDGREPVGGGNKGGGGGIALHNSRSEIINCLLSNNWVNEKGGGLGCGRNDTPSNIILTNCTIVNNYAPDGGALYLDESTVTATNCILWNNDINEDNYYIKLRSATLSIEYCVVQGGRGSIGGSGSCPYRWDIPQNDYNNIEDDPLFVSELNGDYHLNLLSPCIEAGNNDAPSLPIKDIDGDPRIIFRGITTITFPPDPPPTVDIGVDEYNILLIR